MMNQMNHEHKITALHLQRYAYIYVRQSTDRQVRENLESRQRQYELVKLARQHNWAEEAIVVIDDDLGLSASTALLRTGFDKLVADVVLNKVGIIIGIEVSRLARNNKDWYQLLDFCRLTNTLIADFDGIYDPSSFNDRLLLGLKGTMSEAELHILQSRMLQGAYHKAQKGELRFSLPVGYQYDQDGKMIKALDEQIRHMITLTFEKFFELGTLGGVVRYLVEQDVLFPRQAVYEKHVRWVRPYYGAIRDMLKNPLYTGTYVFGRTKTVKVLDENGHQKTRQIRQKMEDWDVMIHEHHPAYISWDQYLTIQAQLAKNMAVPQGQKSQVVREGRALLQGLVVCGTCGCGMQVQYHGQGTQTYHSYVCRKAYTTYRKQICQSIGGRTIDHVVSEIFLKTFQPARLNIHLEAVRQIHTQQDMVLEQLHLQLERAQYEAERIFRQFHAVEPENRLVARTLERQWNEALKHVEELQHRILAHTPKNQERLSEREEGQIRRLANDLPALWNAETTTDKDRKKLLHAAIEEVQITKGDQQVLLNIVWVGGAVTQKQVPIPKRRPKHKTCEDLVGLVRELATKFSDVQIARILVRKGIKTATGLSFNASHVANIRHTYEIPCYQQPQDEQLNTYTAQQASHILQVSLPTVRRWLKDGLLKGEQMTSGAPCEILLSEEEIARLTAKDAPAGWLSVQQAARQFGVSKQTILNWVRAQKVDYVSVTRGKRKILKVDPTSSHNTHESGQLALLS
jgi:DNA invertase Pin-like site-specific DNA recombinase